MNLPEQNFRFRREEHLKRRDDIRAVFKKGKAASCSGAKLFVLRNDLPRNRIAFTFARKYGNAVERNRARRLSREAYRLVSNSLKTGFDMVLLLYPGKDTGNACLDTRLEQLNALLSRAAVLQGK